MRTHRSRSLNRPAIGFAGLLFVVFLIAVPPSGHPEAEPAELAMLAEQPSDGDLVAGRVLVLASWECSFLQLDRVNELARLIVEEPLDRLMEQNRLVGWGQLNGEFRDQRNYHTYYIADSFEQYRSALGQVLTHISRERQGEMEEFYRLCSSTEETAVTVISAHSRSQAVGR